jgi:dimethylsulfide dehydrogenase subunit gamma
MIGKAIAISLIAGGLAHVDMAAADAAEGEANVAAVPDGEVVPVTPIPAGVYLRAANDPTDIIWERVPEHQVWLEPAPPWHPSIELRVADDAEGQPLYFSIVSDRERLYVKLRWSDPSRDVETTADRFRDGAAVQFALGSAEDTPHMMGLTEAPVNIWYWRADSNTAESLAAGGPGSTTRLADQPVSADSAYGAGQSVRDLQWTVVMSRPLAATGEHVVDLAGKSQQPLAFAVWQGAEGQRDGQKSASTDWIMLDLSTLAPSDG